MSIDNRFGNSSAPGETEDSGEERNPVDVLAEEFARRIREGESPSIDEYKKQFPEFAGAIGSVFPAIEKIEKASREQISHSSATNRSLNFDFDLEKIGDFKIIRKLGQGGMGIVYEALQVSLQRNVALKLISPSISGSPKQLERFKREAATAARLHHTNIVPVFGSGEENGIHYFAMQLITGIPLHLAVQNIRQTKSYKFESTTIHLENHTQPQGSSNVSQSHDQTPLTETPSATVHDLPQSDLDPGEDWSRLSADVLANNHQRVSQKRRAAYRNRVCQCVIDIADALQYAHEQGVLHRDIKPSNLLMDQNGTVWVTDFGLAKLEENEVLTKTGDMVGTLRYMAPEQFSGDGDARSDICSLGLTLFELLTLHPAYSETRYGPLLKLKTEQPPPTPRKFDPDVPKDLETIVLKACAIDPKDRYQTAGQFRDDLTRFIDGRPITARPFGMIEQTWRWSKRNPMVASLASLSATLLIAVAVVALIGNQKTRAALKDKQAEYERAEESKTRTQSALEEARKQRQLAEANFSIAIRAFEEIMQNISRRGIPQGIAVEVENDEIRSFETSLTSSDVEVLETLLEFFAEFAEKNRADLLFQSAQAQRRVGDILQRLGRLTEAESVYSTAFDSFSNLTPDKLSESERLLTQMRILNELAYYANHRGDFESAENHLELGQEIYQETADPPPEMHLEYARSLNIYTAMYTRVGYVINRTIFSSVELKSVKRSTSKSPNRKKVDNKGSRPKSDKRKSVVNKRRPKVWVNLNNLFEEKKAIIKKANEESIRILLQLSTEDFITSQVLLELSRAYQDRVRINRYSKDQRAVIKAFDNAKTILQELIEKHPNNPAYRFELADLHCNLERTINGSSGATNAIKIARGLTERWPNVSEYRALYANALARSAIQRISIQSGALKRLEDAVQIYRELVEEFPAHYVYKINFAQYLALLAEQTAKTGKWETASPMFDEATACLHSIESDSDGEILINRILSEVNVARLAAEKLRRKIENRLD